MWTTCLWQQAPNRSTLWKQCTLLHKLTPHLRKARLRWLLYLGPFEMPLLFPTYHTVDDDTELGVGDEQCRAEPTALPSQHGIPPRVRVGWRAASAFPTLPSLPGTRGRAQLGQPLPGPAGAEVRSAAERRPGAFLTGSCPHSWKHGSRAEPSRAALRCAAPRQVRRSPAQTGHLRAAAPPPGQAEVLARPKPRPRLRREPVGAIPTTTQARPSSKPRLLSPPLRSRPSAAAGRKQSVCKLDVSGKVRAALRLAPRPAAGRTRRARCWTLPPARRIPMNCWKRSGGTCWRRAPAHRARCRRRPGTSGAERPARRGRPAPAPRCWARAGRSRSACSERSGRSGSGCSFTFSLHGASRTPSTPNSPRTWPAGSRRWAPAFPLPPCPAAPALAAGALPPLGHPTPVHRQVPHSGPQQVDPGGGTRAGHGAGSRLPAPAAPATQAVREQGVAELGFNAASPKQPVCPHSAAVKSFKLLALRLKSLWEGSRSAVGQFCSGRDVSAWDIGAPWLMELNLPEVPPASRLLSVPSSSKLSHNTEVNENTILFH